MNKQGCVVWFTGIPCSGKTTIADNVAKYLELFGVSHTRLDGDIVRQSLCKGLGFSREDRDENLKRVAFVADLLADAGSIVLCSFVSPFRSQRQMVRDTVSQSRFIEVFVDCDYETCIERDVKGMYKKAIQGIIKNFTGVTGEYERPQDADITCFTGFDDETIEKSTEAVLNELKRKGLL